VESLITVMSHNQLGCGNSDQPNDPSLWSVEFFLEELAKQALFRYAEAL
jgi:hypothetical protein